MNVSGRTQLLAYIGSEVGETEAPARLPVFMPCSRRGFRVLSHLHQSDGKVHAPAIAQHLQMKSGARALLSDLDLKLSGIPHWMAIKADDHVTDLQAALCSRGTRIDLGDNCTGRLVKIEEPGIIRSHIVDADTHVAVGHLAVAHQALGGWLGDLCRNGESHARKSAGGRNQEGVDAHHFSARIDQWSTRVAFVDCGIRLDELAGLSWVIGVRVGTV